MLRTTDHAPGVPAAFTARTRQNSRREGSVVVDQLDAAGLAAATSGAGNELASSTWIV
jgi:hypothetical protein